MGEEGKGLVGVGVVHELEFTLGITPKEVGRGNLLDLASEIGSVASCPWLHDLVSLYLYGMEERTILLKPDVLGHGSLDYECSSMSGGDGRSHGKK